MFAQLIITAILIFTVQALGFINWTTRYSLTTAKKCLPVSLIFCINTVIALKALDGLNIPMYNAIKRCGPIVCLLLSSKYVCGKFFVAQETSRRIYISIFLITFGTFLAAKGDLEFDVVSYMFGCLSVFSAALYFLVVQKLGVNREFDALSMMYINSVTCFPIMLLLAYFSGEIVDVIENYQYLDDPNFYLSFLSVVLFACVFSYSIFLSTTANSALSTILVGVIKSALTTVIGMYTFGGVVPTANFVSGQVLNLTGGALYAFEKYKLKVRRDHGGKLDEELAKDPGQQA